MKINYRNKKLKDLCLVSNEAEKKLGSICARRLRTRLSEIEAAANVKELVIGNPHPLQGNRAGELSLTLNGGVRLTFSPAHNSCPTKADGSIDWGAVNSICIEFIGDYHD